MRSIEYGTPSGNDALTVRFGIERGVFEDMNLDLSVRTVFGGPQIAADVLRGCRLCAHHVAQHVDDFARFIARYYGASEIAALHAVDRELPRCQLDCEPDMTGLQNAVDMLHEPGGIPRAMKAREFIDLRF